MSDTITKNGDLKDVQQNDEVDVSSNGGQLLDGHETDVPEDETKGLPIDRGWAWVVLAATIFYLFLFGGVRKNFGLFFVAFQKRFNSSASLTSLLTTLQSIVISISSLFVMTIGLHFLSCRASIIIGGVLIATANIINGLSEEIGLLFASFGVLEAIGISMVHPPVTSMLGEYFHKRRGMANALAFSGASLGNLVFAPIMTALFDSYGYTGTMFIVAGMTLNTCVTGALMRPIDKFKKTRKLDNLEIIEDEEGDSLIMNGNIKTSTNTHDAHVFASFDKLPNSVSETKKQNGLLFRMHSYDPSRVPVESPLISRKRTVSAHIRSDDSQSRNRTFSGTRNPESHHFLEQLSQSNVSLFTSTAGFCGSIVDVRETMERTLSQTEGDDGHSEHQCSSCKNKTVKILKLLFDTSLFGNPVFRLFMLMAFMIAPSTGITVILVAPHAKDLGLPSDKIGILLSIIGCFDLFGRVALAVFADKKFINRTIVLGVASFLLGTVGHFLRFFTSFESLIVFSVIVGSFNGLYMALYAVILVDYLTLPKLKSCIGFCTLCHGVAMSVFFPIAGSIRDSTGTYVNTYHMLGCLLYCGSAMAFCLPYVYRRYMTIQERKDQEKQEDQV